MNKFVIAAVAACVASSPVFASDFNGPYAGLGVTVDNINGSGSLEGIGFAGAGATGFVGYDLSIGQAFVGAEANIDFNTADAAGIEAKWGWGAGARLGYKVTESTGVYGRVGYQRNRIKIVGLGSDWGDGVRFGGGVETALSGRTSLRAEFNHVNYESDVTNNQGALAVVFHF